MKRNPAMITALAPQTPLPAEIPASVAAAVGPFVDRGELAGAVALVADRERVLSVEAVGLADLAAGTPMREDALFWIASQTKPMTAVAVMMLVDEGRISLDDPVEKYLPEFSGQHFIAERDDGRILLRKPRHPITIREVLSHTSGLSFASAIEEPTRDRSPLDIAVRSYAMMPLENEPGTKCVYSNAGINTAARVLEVVSGLSYEDFLQERLLEPLGMKDTTFWPNEEQVGRLAKSYGPHEAKTGLVEHPVAQLAYPLTDRSRRFPMPAGGLFSTARDVALFCRMLLNGGELDGHRYLGEAVFREFTKRPTQDPVEDCFGLGLKFGPDWFGHGGAYSTFMGVYPSKGITLVWLVQHSGFPGEGANAQEVFKDWALARFSK